MSNITFHWIGWNHEEDHDKVWAVITVNSKNYAVWGRRGGVLKFKHHTHLYSALDLRRTKMNRGYKEVDSVELFMLFPYFERDVGKYLMYAELAGEVM